MAEQMGIIPLKGTIGNINFFKTADGFQARAKGGVTKERIATDPAFNRTRENGLEFGAAGKAGKVLRTAINSLLISTTDKRMVGRLTREMHKVLKADSKNERGKRKVIDGEAALLEGFEFNDQGKLSSTFSAPYSCDINRVTGELKITVPAFIPRNLVTAPAGTTHFKLISGGAEVDFENKSFTADMHSSLELPWNNVATADLVLNNIVSANSTHPLFAVLGVVFYQQVNASMYPLNNGAFNALAIIKVSAP
jgi:hypothetical protein